MPTHVAPRRDFYGLAVRQKYAARFLAAGRETQGAIARRLGVSRHSVMRWYQAWRVGGGDALRAAGRAGRKPRDGKCPAKPGIWAIRILHGESRADERAV
jgi:transposase-like protein